MPRPGELRHQPLGMAKKKEVFFFEKKKQKTFDRGVLFRRLRDSTDQSFLVLFFKKEQSSSV